MSKEFLVKDESGRGFTVPRKTLEENEMNLLHDLGMRERGYRYKLECQKGEIEPLYAKHISDVSLLMREWAQYRFVVTELQFLTEDQSPLRCSPENALKFQNWIANRGGLAYWQSLNLSNPGITWTTPLLKENGEQLTKPTWESAEYPSRIVTSADEVIVESPREVKRFHVAIRRGGGFASFVLTDGSKRKLEKELAKAGKNAWYEFDYTSQDAIIFVPDAEVLLSAWQSLPQS